MTLEEFRRNYTFTMQSRVEWADMDTFQHVNNTLYFRYFERVRVAFFDHIGLTAHRNQPSVGPILHSTRCRFRAPLTYPDSIEIGMCISEVKDDRFLMQYGIYSGKLAALAAEGDGLLVYYDYAKAEKAIMTAEIKKRLAEFMRP